MQLKDKRALVTGASGGIGQAIVATLKDHGAIVTGTDMTPVEADFSIEGDLTNGGFCDQLPLQASNDMGGLDIVVNNAGIITRGDITQATDDDYRRTMAVLSLIHI